MFGKLFLRLEIALYTLRFIKDFVYRSIKSQFIARAFGKSLLSPESKRQLNIVIIGASFAGYHAAKILAESLPATSPYQIIVIEPNSHFQFTWLLPRFSVISGHENKLFIPYGPYIKHNSKRVTWIRDRAVEITRDEILLRDSKDSIAWNFLVVATGSGQTNGLPSRVGSEDRVDGIAQLQALQMRVREAQDLVVVGGGAAGVELAADVKEAYPQKNVTLVHSREALMHRFESDLQSASLRALQDLKVNVLLEERVLGHAQGGFAMLQSGNQIKCDQLIDCVGQRPAFNLITSITSTAVAPSGHIRVKPTLQIADDALPHVYVCGDVADVGMAKPNARAAMMQATIVADNIVLASQGKAPLHVYKPHWIEGVIKLTLGLKKAIVHFSNGSAELLQWTKERKVTLMADETWRAMGVKPEDPEV